MTLALVKCQAYGEHNSDTSKNRGVQVVKMTVTGAATDVTYDISNASGTFWSAIDNTTAGATALTLVTSTITGIAEALIAVQGDFTQSYLRGAATGAGVYTQSVSSKLPSITFHTSDAPTSAVIILKWSLADGVVPITANIG